LRTKLVIAAFLLGIFSLANAKSTKILTSWKNPNFSHSRFHKVMVVGMSDNAPVRADFEDELSAAMKEKNIEAIPGNTLLLRPEGTKVDIEYIKAQIKEHKIDAVIVSRLVSVKTETTYIPGSVYMVPYPYYYSFYGYYSALYPVVYSPDYLRTDKTVRIETNLYATGTPEADLVWTAISDTMNPNNVEKAIKAVVKEVVKQMTKDDVF
jgi:hypothetical protein